MRSLMVSEALPEDAHLVDLQIQHGRTVAVVLDSADWPETPPNEYLPRVRPVFTVCAEPTWRKWPDEDPPDYGRYYVYYSKWRDAEGCQWNDYMEQREWNGYVWLPNDDSSYSPEPSYWTDWGPAPPRGTP
jgi:hypothetical protein